MKKIALTAGLMFAAPQLFACITCNRAVQEGIYNSTFYPNLLTMLSAFIVLAVIKVALAVLATRRYKARLAANPDLKELTWVPLASASAVLGIGLGGFADGIVLHQILQWHEMLTNKIPADTLVGKSVNMFWDGIFHMFTLITTIIGVYLLWRLLNKVDINRSGYLLAGGMLGGWGLFNLVEGIIDHQILKLHNVYEYTPDPDIYNYAFLASGVILMIIGWLMIKKGAQHFAPA